MKRNLFFFSMWILVGLLGFVIGMKWSIFSENDREGKPEISSTKVTITRDALASRTSKSIADADWQSTIQMDITMVEKTLQLLKEEYVYDVNATKAINGALKGMKSLLAGKKLKTDLIKLTQADDRSDSAMIHLKKTYSTILAHYGGKLNESHLAYSALKGVMDSLGDPYSVVLEPKEYKLLNEQMNGGNYGGIGVYIELSRKKGNVLTVIEPIEGSPAQKAGIKAGDVVLKINGESTKGMDLEVAAQKIRGEVGSSMTMTIKRGDNQPKTFKMLRDLIHVSSVTHAMKPGDIAYIRVRFFGSDTDVEFARSLEKAQALGAKALIIDLRNNGGGYISAAIDICSKLLQSGTLVVSVVNHRTGRNEIHKASGSDQTKLPIAVLVNDMSASAAEITAGALKDTGTGILIGEKTFGKGSVQTIHELRDGGALKYTIARYLTPKGNDINKKGIEPDIVVEMDPSKVESSQDTQLQKAQSYLKKKLQETPGS